MEFFDKIFDWLANLSARIPSFEFGTFFLAAVIALAVLGIVIGLTYLGTPAYKLKRASSKILKYLADEDRIDDDNLGDFTAQCFSSSAPRMLRESWVKYLGVRFGYPSDIVTEADVFDREVKKAGNVRANIFISVALILLAVFAFIGFGALTKNGMSVVHCTGLLLSGVIYLALSLAGKSQYKKAKQVFNDMQDELDAKVDFQVENNYSTETSPLIELSAIIDGIIAKNTAKFIGITDEMNEAAAVTQGRLEESEDMEIPEADVTERPESEIASETDETASAENDTVSESEIVSEAYSESREAENRETENGENSESEDMPHDDAKEIPEYEETPLELLAEEPAEFDFADSSDARLPAEDESLDNAEAVTPAEEPKAVTETDEPIGREPSDESFEETDGYGEYNVEESIESADEKSSENENTLDTENESVIPDSLRSEESEVQSDDEIAEAQAKQETETEAVLETAPITEGDGADTDALSVNDSDEVKLNEAAADGDEAAADAVLAETFEKQDEADRTMPVSNADDELNSGEASGEEIENQSEDESDMFGRKKNAEAAKAEESVKNVNDEYVEGELIDDYYESEILDEQTAEETVTPEILSADEAEQPVASEDAQSAEEISEEAEEISEADDQVDYVDSDEPSDEVADEQDHAPEIEAEEEISGGYAEESESDEYVEEYDGEPAAEEEESEVVYVVEDEEEDETAIKPPKLAKLPHLLDYMLTMNISRSNKIKLASMLLSAYGFYKKDPANKEIVLQCLFKIMGNLQKKG